MISFGDKIFLSLLAALPLLTAIYFLFRKSRPLVVSALMLWAEQKQSRRSGMILKKMPLPLTYFLELLILAAFALAAATPLLLRKNDASPMTLVLDNSFSMRAGLPRSVQSSARREIDKLTGGMSGRKFRIIIAGTEPRNLGVFTAATDIEHALGQWTCDETGESLTQAVAMARRLDREQSAITVFTDHPPADATMPDNLSWRAMGSPLDNTAIVNAARGSSMGKDRAMVMVANLSGRPCRSTLKVTFPGTAQAASISELALDAGQLKKISLELPAASGPVEFSLSDDALDYDNRIVLLPENRPPLRTRLQIADPRLEADIRRALESSGRILFTGDAPALTVTDRAESGNGNGYRLILRTATAGKSSAGPFTVSRNHPLCAGIDLGGVVWGFPADAVMAGVPLIAAGDVPLVTFDARGDSAGDIYMAFVPSASTLQGTPAWPVLFWNLAEWLSGNRPGPLRANFRSDEKIPFNHAEKTGKLTLRTESGQAVAIPVTAGRQLLNINVPGTYELSDGPRHYQFRVNPLNYGESDLSRCGTASYDGPRSAAAILRNYRNIAWIPLLAALSLLAIHQLIIGRRPKNDLQ